MSLRHRTSLSSAGASSAGASSAAAISAAFGVVLTLLPVTAHAQDEATTPPAAGVTSTTTATATATNDPPAAAAADTANEAGSVSVALERVGGISYSSVSQSDSDSSGSLFALGVGSVNVNPYTAPRLGVDYRLPIGLTLGASLGFGHFSLAAKSKGKSEDLGSLTLYTFTPRVGYRIPLAKRFDLVPRAGLTLAGGSLTSGNGRDSNGVFAVALSGEAVGVVRLTSSFNFLVGAGIDQTVAASTSSSSTNGGGASRSSSSDIKGSLLTAQLWLGLGGYL